MFSFFDEFNHSVNLTSDIPDGIYTEFLHRYETKTGEQLIIAKYEVNQIPTVFEMVFIANSDSILVKELIYIGGHWRDDYGNLFKSVMEALPIPATNLMLIEESAGAIFAKE